MKTKLLVGFTVLTMLLMFAPPKDSHAQSSRPEARPGEYIIQLSSEVEAGAAAAALAVNEESIEIVSERFNVVKLQLTEEAGPLPKSEEVRQALLLNPSVVVAEPNFIYYAAEQPFFTDPGLDQLWYLEKIGAYSAWQEFPDSQVITDSETITVAVIDTGVFLEHEDLQDHLVAGQDFYNNDMDPSPDLINVPKNQLFCDADPVKFPSLFKGKAYEAHGTHVAGTIGAVRNNGIGITGITQRVKLIPLKFLGGSCGSGDLADALRAIEYAIDHHARIINASWSGPYSTFLQEIIDEASQAGILFMAAAGNEHLNIDVTRRAPASYDLPNVITVGASTQVDARAGFSNYGESVEIAAPGVEILSTVPMGKGPQPESGYAKFQGTSMATPIVAGATALLMARYPQLSHLEVKELLLSTTDTVPELLSFVAEGRRLNLASALQEQPLSPELSAILESLPEEERRQVLDSLSPLDRVRLTLNPVPVTSIVAVDTVEITATETITGTEAITGTEEITSSEMMTGTELITRTEELTSTQGQLQEGESIILLISFNQPLYLAEITKLLQEFPVEQIDEVSKRLNVYEVTIDSSLALGELIAELEKIPGVRYVEPNVEFRKN